MSVSKLIALSLAITIASFLFSTGCEQDEDQVFEPEPNVFAVMKIGDQADIQVVNVELTYDIRDTVVRFEVPDAQVRIWGGADTFDFQYCEDCQYMQQASFNDTILYTLQVIYPEGDTVMGQSYMPSPVNINWPVEGETLSINQEVANPRYVTWGVCNNTGLYILQCSPDVDTSEIDEYNPFLYVPSFTADTSYLFFVERVLSPWVYDMDYKVRASAYGTEYASYVQLGLSVGQANLTNQDGDTCYGIFSGISIDSVRVYITE
jgi:hypothetical protein